MLNKLPTPPRLTNDTSTFTKTITKTNLKKQNDEANDFDRLRNEKQGNLLQSNDNNEFLTTTNWNHL